MRIIYLDGITWLHNSSFDLFLVEAPEASQSG